MPQPNGNGARRELPEASMRVLQRIADQMRSRFTGKLEIDLNQGGVGSFREIRSWRLADLETPTDLPTEI
jgi:hypothetical protein